MSIKTQTSACRLAREYLAVPSGYFAWAWNNSLTFREKSWKC